MTDIGRVTNAHQQIKIKVVDKDGWQKEFPFQKSIIHIGSNPRSDLFLEASRGTGVASLHAQLIVSTARAGCQLVNLGNTDILLGPSGDQSLPPRSVTSVVSGTVIKLGDFTLTLYSDGVEDEDVLDNATSPSQNIGLNVSLPKTKLAVNESLSGAVTVGNLGEQAGVQFDLELEGLEPDCYDIEPGPLLSSGAEKDAVFHIYHQGNKPLAGARHISISAAAPQAYPGEQATVSRTIQVLPLYHHKLRLVFPDEAPSALQVENALEEDALPAEKVEERQVSTSDAVSPPQVEDWWSSTVEEPVPSPPEAMEQIPQPEVPISLDTKVTPQQVMEEEEPSVSAKKQLVGKTQNPVLAVSRKMKNTVGVLGADLEEQELAPVISPLSETEAEAVPVAEAIPSPPTEDWWSPEAEAAPEEDGRTSSLEVREELVPKVESAPMAKAGPLPSAEDWWSPEAQVSPEEQAELQVLKLKASPPPETEAELAVAAEAGPPSSAEDWWSSETTGGLQVEDRAVLKLKASPSPQTDAEPAQVAASPSPAAEDWWSVEEQEDSDQ